MRIEEFELYKWMKTSDSKTKPEVLINSLKKRIDDFGDFEFNSDYTKFRRIQSWKEFEEIIDDPNHKGYTRRYHDSADVKIDYSHLEVKIKMDDGKKKKRRAV